jgi:phage terminase large subunit
MLIKGRINFEPKPHQLAVMTCDKRHRCAVMHRRAGKTVMAVFSGLEAMLSCPLPYPRVGYISPYLKQSKKLAWDYLATTAANGGRFFDINRGELTVTFEPTGAKFSLYGADNIDAIRGVYFDLVIVDELADCDPRLWSSVLRYCLADRNGRALMMGTPRGRMNMLYDLSRLPADNPDWAYFCYPWQATGMLSADEVEAIRRDPDMSEAMFAQELECSFNAALIGAVYGHETNELQSKGRYTTIEYDAALPVMTSWDLGWRDATAVIYWQRVGTELRVICCEEYTLTALPKICQAVISKPWANNYIGHYGPHDLAVTEYGSGYSRWQIAANHGVEFEPTVNWSLEDGIEAARAILPHVWVSEQNASRFLECCANYRFVFDDQNRSFKTKPLHDWTSHVADALRIFAVAHDPALLTRQPPNRRRRSREGSQGWLF